MDYRRIFKHQRERNNFQLAEVCTTKLLQRQPACFLVKSLQQKRHKRGPESAVQFQAKSVKMYCIFLIQLDSQHSPDAFDIASACAAVTAAASRTVQVCRLCHAFFAPPAHFRAIYDTRLLWISNNIYEWCIQAVWLCTHQTRCLRRSWPISTTFLDSLAVLFAAPRKLHCQLKFKRVAFCHTVTHSLRNSSWKKKQQTTIASIFDVLCSSTLSRVLPQTSKAKHGMCIFKIKR